MPTPSLPPSPPAVVQPSSQQQSQNQSSYNAPSIESSNTNNAGSESNSESTGLLNQSSELSNIQVNNSNTGVFGFGLDTFSPTPTINVTGYTHGGHSGVAATFTVPLGGTVGRQHRRLIDSRIKRIDLDNNAVALQSELELATACAKIAASGAVIDYSQFPSLARCKYVSVQQPPSTRVVVIPKYVSPPVQKLVPPVRIEMPPKQELPKRPIRGLW